MAGEKEKNWMIDDRIGRGKRKQLWGREKSEK